MTSTTELNLAYWAGVFDFAGSIRWRGTSATKHVPTICLARKDIRGPKQAKELFGGGIRREDRYFRWETTGSNAARVIGLLAPHLRKGIDPSLLLWKASKRGPRVKQQPAQARLVCFE
jgi:hypothetical protein